MSGPGDDDDDPGYASPPCLMHELDPTFRELKSDSDARTARDVARWRKAERERLIAARRELDVATRRAAAARIAGGLDAELGDVGGRTVGCYWPIRGEPDLRPWIATLVERGAVCALPVVVRLGEPLLFHRWRPGERLVPGHWNIPVPAEPVPVVPDLVIAPLVGFDSGCYRLGYGGGFFDRTLAGLGGRAQAVGVGYASARLATIFPQWHDVPMDLLVTEEGIVRRASA
jgi:5,10-methenyltetrahydrofolate synthetase